MILALAVEYVSAAYEVSASGYYQWQKRQEHPSTRHIEAFYNRERLHSSLGYQSPIDFEAQHK